MWHRAVLEAAPSDPSAFNNMGNVSMAMGAHACASCTLPNMLVLVQQRQRGRLGRDAARIQAAEA